MYKVLLILKYLRKRRLAWWSLIAVALCTTMVLVVMSVMGGWVDMFRQSYHALSGDIVIRGNRLGGLPHYDQIIQRLQKEVPGFKAAAPIINTYGLANINGQVETMVRVVGYPPNIGQVDGFVSSLYRLKDTKDLTFGLWPDRKQDYVFSTPRTYKSPRSSLDWRGMIVGSGVIGLKKDESGIINRPDSMYNYWVQLHVLAQPPGGASFDMTEKVADYFWVIDDSRTKVSIIDANTVYVPFDRLQTLLQMTGGSDAPARCTEIQVAMEPGADLNKAKTQIEEIVAKARVDFARQDAIQQIKNQVTDRALKMAEERKLDDKAAEKLVNEQVQAALAEKQQVDAMAEGQLVWNNTRFPSAVNTWREAHKEYLDAIEHERGLIAILFGLISLVAIVLILCIFYMIVVEKTRDIGTVKAVGATPGGVACIFLGYGFIIGVLGAALGLLLSYLIVHNINELHAWLGKFGIVIWNPDVYLFDIIPDTINLREAIIIVSVAIISSTIGALVPAYRAARMHPVEALRWE